ncbi:hypothetical protein FNV43_RR20970 [Rhamnella rubrinervis]|uniref:Uncharacterized protein n=1 Tax=Rhamnella rubrinervis TaxID=2594499 RepID=A0A8K0E2F9_9ROSA|nr:hypothetical protein FNV43_RR20970 [Rhamnella rubrinervis]
MVAPRGIQKFGGGGIFPKGVAVWDPHAMMVGNVRPGIARKRQRYRVWVGLWGLECAWGSEGMLVAAVVLVACWCWGLSSGARHHGWSLVLWAATCIAFKACFPIKSSSAGVTRQ